jgi:hypothetical protein
MDNPYQSPLGMPAPSWWESWGRLAEQAAFLLVGVVLVYALLPLWCACMVWLCWPVCNRWERALVLSVACLGCFGWGLVVGELLLGRA